MKLIWSAILILNALGSSSYAEEQVKMSLRDQEYKKSHLSTLGPKKGYQGNKDWDNFVKMAIKYKDDEIIKKMLGVEPTAQTERAQYIYDLHQIYKARPEFFIEVANDFYKKEMNCVVRLFKTDPQVLTDKEVQISFNKKNPSKTFSEYVKLSKKTDLTSLDQKTKIEIAAKCDLLKQQK